MRKKIVFMGTPEFAVPILEKLIKNYQVLLVVTQPDKPIGRKRILEASPIKKLAKIYGIEVFQPLSIRKDYQKIIDLAPDILITAAYGQMIPKMLLDSVKSINIHGSLLPEYRGGAPIQKALMDGKKITGITIMYMADKMDSGDILYQEELLIAPGDNYQTLTKRLSELGTKMIEEYLPKILNNEEIGIPQDEVGVTFAYNIKRNDEIIDFNNQTIDIINLIRGLSPEPGATAFIKDSAFKVYSAENSDIILDVLPGTIINLDKKLIVKTSDGSISLLEVQLQGKKQMDIRSFLNGQSILRVQDVFTKEEKK